MKSELPLDETHFCWIAAFTRIRSFYYRIQRSGILNRIRPAFGVFLHRAALVHNPYDSYPPTAITRHGSPAASHYEDAHRPHSVAATALQWQDAFDMFFEPCLPKIAGATAKRRLRRRSTRSEVLLVSEI